MTGAVFTFDVVSPKYGRVTVTAPERFRGEIESRHWCLKHDPKRRAGSQLIPYWKPRSVNGRQQSPVKMHQLIWRLLGRVGSPDHKDQQPLNNSEDNLRDATNGQQQMNQDIGRTNRSGRLGVSWDAQHKRWRAQIAANRKRYFLGLFDSIEEASRARDEAARRLHGEFAVLNEDRP